MPKLFVSAGLRVLEVTLRTPVALEAIRAMAKVPGAIVGAGTVLNTGQLDEAARAGSHFIVSPGLTEPLAKAVIETGIAYLPGVATAGDIMRGLDLGTRPVQVLFPAEASGGIGALKAQSAPFGQVQLSRRAGSAPTMPPRGLSMRSVLCVGGSWLYRGVEDSLEAVAERSRAAAALHS